MTAGWRTARGAAGVAIAPEAIQYDVLQRLAREVGLLAHQLLKLVCLVLVIERVVVQHGQRLLIQIVGDHGD